MAGRPWLVTGGAGYIGAHVVRSLVASGRDVVVVDDLSTGVAARVPEAVDLHVGSVADLQFMTDVLRSSESVGVIHLAAKKSPTESVSDPLSYAGANVGGMINLVTAVRAAGCSRIVFSSSCSVYGTPDLQLVGEDAPKKPQSPYGESKLYGEQLLASAAAAYDLGVISLRYFNVVGAADPVLRDDGAYNLVPLVFKALHSGDPAQVFGADYPTPDGTCVRDYVDVEDVADAHVRAAEALERQQRNAVYNVGRGEGTSVLEILAAVRSITGASLEAEMCARRAGDPARIVGQVDLIADELGWRARRGLHDMISSAWLAERSIER